MTVWWNNSRSAFRACNILAHGLWTRFSILGVNSVLWSKPQKPCMPEFQTPVWLANTFSTKPSPLIASPSGYYCFNFPPHLILVPDYSHLPKSQSHYCARQGLPLTLWWHKCPGHCSVWTQSYRPWHILLPSLARGFPFYFFSLLRNSEKSDSNLVISSAMRIYQLAALFHSAFQKWECSQKITSVHSKHITGYLNQVPSRPHFNWQNAYWEPLFPISLTLPWNRIEHL